MTDGNKQKEIADKALEMLYPICPNAIVAGGAPRDWFLGNTAKDIDIFITADDRWVNKDVTSVLRYVGFENASPIVPNEVDFLNYTKNPRIKAVYNCKLDSQDIQIIVLFGRTYTIVDTFAFNICKAWYKNGKVNTTPDFNYAVTNKVLIKQGELYASTKAYRDKIIAKFPDYKYYESEYAFLQRVTEMD